MTELVFCKVNNKNLDATMVLCQNKDEGRVSMDAAILWWQTVTVQQTFYPHL